MFIKLAQGGRIRVRKAFQKNIVPEMVIELETDWKTAGNIVFYEAIQQDYYDNYCRRGALL